MYGIGLNIIIYKQKPTVSAVQASFYSEKYIQYRSRDVVIVFHCCFVMMVVDTSKKSVSCRLGFCSLI